MRSAESRAPELVKEDSSGNVSLLGFMVVFVDDFLLQGDKGPVKDDFLTALRCVWTLAKEETLTIQHPINFLGIQLCLRPDGDVFLNQRALIDSILHKHGCTNAKGTSSVSFDKLPTEPEVPTPAELKVLQGSRESSIG